MTQQTLKPHPPQPHSPSSLAALTQRNIELITSLESAEAAKRSFTDRFSDIITRFCGHIAFIYVHVIWFGGWILWNLFPRLPQALRFDPFPFQFLALAVSLEAIFLTTFILISQNRQNQLSERRNHLDLQINLLSEQENSKILSMLETLLQHHGLLQHDPDLAALKEVTQPEILAQQIDLTLEQNSQEEPPHEGTGHPEAQYCPPRFVSWGL